MKQFFPFLDWMTNYKKNDFSGDLTAGLTVGVMLIPQGMAYSMLAGLPPIYGLYASTIPLIIYALFGTSRQLAVGPVAMVALLISTGVGALAELGSPEFIGLAITLALMVGVIQFAMGVFRLGFLVNFLSHPVLSGFTSAAALIIGFSQLKHLLGIKIPRGKVHETLINVFENIQAVNFPTLAIGIVAIAILLIIKRVNRRIPGPLIVVLGGIIAVIAFGLDAEGVKIVKEVPSGLPSFGTPTINGDVLTALIPTALTIALVGFMESIAVAKAIQAKHKDYKVVPNQELIGLGLANIVGAFFKAFPVTGGFSRTAVNDQAGARTGLASIISAVLVVLTLLFLTDYFYYLPNAVLAAIIMVAVFGLIDYKEAIHLWHTDKRDFWMLAATFVGTLVLTIEEGIIIGVVLSLAVVIYQTTQPHLAILGKIPNSNFYKNITRYDDLIEREDVLVVRFDSHLYFGNVAFFKDQMEGMMTERGEVLKLFILDANSINSVDSSGMHALEEVLEFCKTNDTLFYMTSVKGPVRDTFKRTHFTEKLGKNHFFLDIQNALDYYDTNERQHIEAYALQHNEK